MDIEAWVIALLDKIKEASEDNADFTLHLTKEATREIAGAWDKTEWIEIY